MIWLVLEGLPPSANNAYLNLPKGRGRTLTKEGRKYLTETKATLARQYPKVMTFFKKDTPYLLLVRFRIEAVENKGWAKGTAETRYKKLDVGNRLKLLEDAFKDAAGIDDSQHMTIILDKKQAAAGDGETTEVFAWDLSAEASPFDDALQRL